MVQLSNIDQGLQKFREIKRFTNCFRKRLSKVL